jgi:hypothetical protein
LNLRPVNPEPRILRLVCKGILLVRDLGCSLVALAAVVVPPQMPEGIKADVEGPRQPDHASDDQRDFQRALQQTPRSLAPGRTAPFPRSSSSLMTGRYSPRRSARRCQANWFLLLPSVRHAVRTTLCPSWRTKPSRNPFFAIWTVSVVRPASYVYNKKARVGGLFDAICLVGARGFEPPTPRSRTECSTRLSHAPTRRKDSRENEPANSFRNPTRPQRQSVVGLWPVGPARLAASSHHPTTGLRSLTTSSRSRSTSYAVRSGWSGVTET